jgi:hypothetical protein
MRPYIRKGKIVYPGRPQQEQQQPTQQSAPAPTPVAPGGNAPTPSPVASTPVVPAQNTPQTPEKEGGGWKTKIDKIVDLVKSAGRKTEEQAPDPTTSPYYVPMPEALRKIEAEEEAERQKQNRKRGPLEILTTIRRGKQAENIVPETQHQNTS